MPPSKSPKKIVFSNSLSPGDIVMLTAAVRDLHECNPGKFKTDVRTTAKPLWEHNPHISPLCESDEDVELVQCEYPLIHNSNQRPFHFIHGFAQFISDKLGVPVIPSEFKGDIHLSKEEQNWIPQIEEITGSASPYWIIVAGGKMDYTIKWWSPERFQKVVDHFDGRIQFVQVGEKDHHHTSLKNVIDLRGKTDIRQLVRLVYHSQGVLSPVTFLMHLAAAVPTKSGQLASRPCVVVAGGREPSHWEAYPGHRFLHTQGALPCCETGGCWKARTVPIGDGDQKDRRENLCERVAENGLPRCMDMISEHEVISAIQSYFDGGVIRFIDSKKIETPAPQTSELSVPNSVESNSEGSQHRGTPKWGIKIYSLRRSGTHAITNWISSHFTGNIFYANDVLNRHSNLESGFECDVLPAIDGRVRVPLDFSSSNSSDVSIAIFEDVNFGSIWEGEEKAFSGKRTNLRILVLRDPFNMLASRMALTKRKKSKFITDRMLKTNGNVPVCVSIWKSYARQFLELKKTNSSSDIAVNYNRWAVDGSYRHEISEQLNRPFTDSEKERVPGDGFGSSFDGVRLNNNASKMKVLERWRSFEDDPDFKRWINDDELQSLSEDIFGKIT